MSTNGTRTDSTCEIGQRHAKSTVSTAIVSIVHAWPGIPPRGLVIITRSSSNYSMARPRKYKTQKEQVEAARRRRREWYYRNRSKESAKSLARYHRLSSINFEPQVQSPSTHVQSPIDEEELDEQPQVHPNSDTPIAVHMLLDTRAMLTAAQDAMRTWHIAGEDIGREISEAQRIFDLWTCGLLRAWGSSIYLSIELDTDALQAETELQPYLTLGKELQDRFEVISPQSFIGDPSGSAGTWNAAQFLRRQIARAVDTVEEFCLILRDGGVASLRRSYMDHSLNFQLL
ncbi:hypothetical protein BD410DRAFT_808108 [Rickenella mellea]|uniref:Uncharacterized protein n=1 Tax=Rickenella mellea TaxID=50990 RepID=A0A4Y7PM08_9AGAM|nr:hypothetical protein BD410DRAFT_808108 [Rickenella mellea]